MGHRHEMADLRALHRAVWGDVAYERHLAAKRDSVLRRVAFFALVAVTLTALGAGLISATRATNPKGSSTTAPQTAPTARSSTTVRNVPTVGSSRTVTTRRRPATASTTSTASTASTQPRPPLAQTGFDSRPLLVIAMVLIASGIAVAARRREGR